MDLEAYVRQQNLELYRKLLSQSHPDDPKRVQLMQLLAEEKAKESAAGKGHRRRN